MENESFAQRALKTTGKILKRTLLILLVIGLAVVSFLYFATVEEGVMAGKVLRVSKKGILFKTFEGKLNLETFGALKGASPISESFDFSVKGDLENVIKDLEQVALSGERVNLKFEKHYITVPWRGDTKYFVIEVERLK
jgi:hypothetical protein